MMASGIRPVFWQSLLVFSVAVGLSGCYTNGTETEPPEQGGSEEESSEEESSQAGTCVSLAIAHIDDIILPMDGNPMTNIAVNITSDNTDDATAEVTLGITCGDGHKLQLPDNGKVHAKDRVADYGAIDFGSEHVPTAATPINCEVNATAELSGKLRHANPVKFQIIAQPELPTSTEDQVVFGLGFDDEDGEVVLSEERDSYEVSFSRLPHVRANYWLKMLCVG